jgi:hypothetical protein
MGTIARRSPGAWVLALTVGGCMADPAGWETYAASEGTEGAEHDGATGSTDGSTAAHDGEDTGDSTDATDAADPAPQGDTGAVGSDGGDPNVPPEEAPRVRVVGGETKNAELVKTLPVGQSEASAERRVVLRLAPDALPDLLAGDRLITPAEVQVTTRCDVGQTAPGCEYDPKIRAQLVLGNEAESAPLSSPQTKTCTKGEHHCMFVMRPVDATNAIDDALLPCVAAGDCAVSLVMWAFDAQARPDGQDVVIVGGNEGNFLDNGIVESDKARLMAIRERGIEDADRQERETTGGSDASVPTDASPVLVYSHELAAEGESLLEGEQFVVEAKIVASVGGRARFSTLMFLTDDASATDGGGLEQTTPKQIGEHNGINCLPSQSPCTTRKVAVFAVTEDVAGPVHVNVVVKSAVPGGGSTSVTVHRSDGWLRSTRYDPQHEG